MKKEKYETIHVFFDIVTSNRPSTPNTKVLTQTMQRIGQTASIIWL